MCEAASTSGSEGDVTVDGAGLGGSVEAEVWELLADNEAVADDTVLNCPGSCRDLEGENWPC